MQALVAMSGLLNAIETRLRRVTRSSGFQLGDLPVAGLLYTSMLGPWAMGMSGSLIADRLGRHRQSVQVTLERLESAELVEAVRDDLGRASEWRLTRRGLERWDRLTADLARIEEHVFRGDARGAVAHFDELLERVRSATFLACVGMPDARGESSVELVDLASEETQTASEERKARAVSFRERLESFASVTTRRRR